MDVNIQVNTLMISSDAANLLKYSESLTYNYVILDENTEMSKETTFQANTLMISDAAQNSRFEREEAKQRELLVKLEGLEAADVYLQVRLATIEKNGGK